MNQKRRSQLQTLVHTLASERKITKRLARQVLDGGVRKFKAEIGTTGRFSWPGFGTWHVSRRKERVVMNPQTQQLMRIPSTLSVHFRPSRSFVKWLVKMGWR